MNQVKRIPTLQRVRVYATKQDEGWVAVVLQRGPDQSLVRFTKADADMIGKERVIANRFLKEARREEDEC